MVRLPLSSVLLLSFGITSCGSAPDDFFSPATRSVSFPPSGPEESAAEETPSDDSSGDEGTPPFEDPTPTDEQPEGEVGLYLPLGVWSAGCPVTPEQCEGFWPPEDQGEVLLFESLARGHEEQMRRFFVYVPARVRGPVPVVIVLHPGFEDDKRSTVMFLDHYDELADGRVVSWERNRDDCTLDSTSALGRFLDSDGTPCPADVVEAVNSQPFVLVLPEGLVDVDGIGRHWEDGRSPSPGSRDASERRDDVRFLEHIIDRVEVELPDLVDPTRFYVVGHSDGGLLTTRAACSTGATPRPIRRIAAYAAVTATMAAPLVFGTEGRERCDAAHPFGLALFLGTGRDTPDCDVAGCATEPASGDGKLVFGQRERFYRFGNDGMLWNGLDVITTFANQQQEASGNLGLTREFDNVGGFTSVGIARFRGTDAEVHSFVTEGGRHGTAVARADYLPAARIIDFLLRFERSEGTLNYDSSASPIVGEF